MSCAHKISLKEAAGFLECSEDRVLELIRERRIPAIKPGKAYVIPREAFYVAVNRWSTGSPAGNWGVQESPSRVLFSPRTARSA